MPIKPIDIISMPNRTQAVTEIQQEANQRHQQADSQINMSFSKQLKQNSQQPVQTTKSENKEYRYDAKEKGNNTSYNGNSKKKKQKDEKEEKLEIGTSKFDIKI
jgi:hypothetical protein